MDEEMSRRIRQVLQDAVDRQRPPADTDAVKRQMLVTTLRLAGHTVRLAPGFPASPSAADQPDDAARADQPTGTLPAATLGIGNPLFHDGLDRVDDPTRPAGYGKPQLLPLIINDPTRPADDGKPQLLPYIVTGPSTPAAGGSPRPKPITVPQPYRISSDAVSDESGQDSAAEDESGSSSSGLEIKPVDSDGYSQLPVDPSVADTPLVGDAPPPLPIAPGGDPADPDPSPAPGIKLFFPSPGAVSFSVSAIGWRR